MNLWWYFGLAKLKVGKLLSNLLLAPPRPCFTTNDEEFRKKFPQYRHEQIAIGWNLYRCKTCAKRSMPERWWHQMLWQITDGRYDPFGRGRI